MDLGRVPLLLEADFLSSFIQMQCLNDPSHFTEVETPAISKVLIESWAECNRHWSIL